MRNFEEIKIKGNNSPELSSLPKKETAPQNPHETKTAQEILRQKFIKSIVEFDQAHRNESLDFEEKLKLYQKIFIALSVAALSVMADQSGNLEKPEERNKLESKIPGNDNPSSREEEAELRISKTNDLLNLEKIRQQIQKSYKKELQKNELLIIKIEPEGRKTKPHNSDMEKESPAKKAHDIAVQIQALSRNILKNDEFFPRKIFSQDFLLCIQANESGFKKDAVSPVGAVGSMQVMPETVRDVIKYINRIDSRIDFKKEDLNDETLNEIIKLIRQNYNLGEAFGKLYLAQIFNGFGIGQKSLENNWISLGREKILATYNWGIGNFSKNPTDKKSWPNETKEYIEKIFSDMKTLQKINARLDIDDNNQKIQKSNKKEGVLGLKTDPKAIKKALVLEMRKFKNKKPEEIAAILNRYLGEIRIREKINKKPLEKRELEKIARQLKATNPELWASN
ncbi:MAG: lytic transglycosylase domain-containing protein [Candidatus Moraniibacteriota bacterium]